MPLTTFAAAVAVAVSLMFVTVLLAAGALALEREQNTFTRLVRGPVSPGGCWPRRSSFAVAGSLPVTLLMLLAVAAFVPVEWDRFHLWLVVAVAGAAAFAAMGTLDRRARARGAGGVAAGLHAAPAGRVPGARARGRRERGALRRRPGWSPALFPFDPTVDAMTSALYGEGGLLGPLLHLAALGLAYGARSSHRDLAAWLRGGCGAQISCDRMSFPATRLRRLRQTSGLRGLVRETELSVDHLVYPLFVTHGEDRREPVESMPGIERLTISHLEEEAGEIAALGIPAVLLFGIPADKDEAASGAYDAEGIVQLAVRALKQAEPELIVITDVCLCEYMSHGHCGVVREDGVVDNDVTLELLAKTAISHAEAGADAVAPSDMMDGRVAAIRAQLDSEGHTRAADRRLQREVRVRLLRPVPRGRRFGARVRRPARVPDGPGQRARGGARGA